MSSLKKQKQDLLWEKKWRNLIHQRTVKEEMNKQLKASLERQKREEEEKECTFKPQTLWNQSFRKTVSFVDEFFVKLQPYIEQQQAYLKQLQELEQEDKLFAEKVKEELRTMLSKAVDREIMETIIEGYKGVRTRGMNKVKREKLDILSKMIKLERDYNCFMARENVDKRDLEECGFDCDLAAKLRNDILKESLCPNSLRDFAKIRQEINNVLEEELQISENKNIENDRNKHIIKEDEYEEEEEEENENEEDEEKEEEEEDEEEDEEEEEETDDVDEDNEENDEVEEEEERVLMERKKKKKNKKTERNKTGTEYIYDNKIYFKKEKKNEITDKKVITYMKNNSNNIKWDTVGSVEKRGIETKNGINGTTNFKSMDNLKAENSYINYEDPIFDINGYIGSVPKNSIYNSNMLYKIDSAEPSLTDSFAVRARKNSYYLDRQTAYVNSPAHSKNYRYQYTTEPKLYLKPNDASSIAYANEYESPFEVNNTQKNMTPSKLQSQPHMPFIKEFMNESSNKQSSTVHNVTERLYDVEQMNSINDTTINGNNKYANHVIPHNNMNFRNTLSTTNPAKNNNNKSIFLNNNYMKMLNKEEAVKYASNWKKEANSMNVVILNEDKQENIRGKSISNVPHSNISKWDGVIKEQNKQNKQQINKKEMENFITFSSPLYSASATKNVNWSNMEKSGINKNMYASVNNTYLRPEMRQAIHGNKMINEENGKNKNTIFINNRTFNSENPFNNITVNNSNAPYAGLTVKTMPSKQNAVDTDYKNSSILKQGLGKYKKKEFPLFKKFV